jgi:YhcH/YjgK/YiaL family protein
MILDVIANEEHLKKLHPGFGPALDYLRSTNLGQLADGRHEIDGARLFAMVSRGPGRTQKGARLELHRLYIDIQYSITGADVIGWKPASACRDAEQAFDEKKDIQFFFDAPDSWVTIPQGNFAIFYPHDAHAPMATEGTFHKVIIKIAVDW